jgi:hypothetical protein
MEVELLSYGIQPIFAFTRYDGGIPRGVGFVESEAG